MAVRAAIGLLVALGAAGCAPSDAPLVLDRARAAEAADHSRRRRPRHRPAPTTTTLDLSVLPSCWPDPSFGQPSAAPVPADLAAALDAFAADARIAPNAASVSVWIDGLGEVLTRDPDVALAPASNQKLLTAMGALAVLGPDTRLVTEVRLAPSGDLVIVPGGDPTLASTGPHSLAELAAQVRSHGVTQVAGALLVDETRHDGARRASGWQDWQIPTYTGPLSALMVDRNRWRADPAFLADPALGERRPLPRCTRRAGRDGRGPHRVRAHGRRRIVARVDRVGHRRRARARDAPEQ